MTSSHLSHAGTLLAALASISVAGCRSCERGRQPAPPASAVSTTPAELATLDLPELADAGISGAEVEGFVDAWGTAGAFLVRTASGTRLVHGRQTTREYPAIRHVTLGGGGKVAFDVPDERGERVRVVLPGTDPGTAYDEVDGLVFTRDGRLAYKARAGDRWRLVVDGSALDERSALGDLRVAPDGTTLRVVERATPEGPLVVAAYGRGRERTALWGVAAEGLFLNAEGTLAAAVTATDAKKRLVVRSLADGATQRQGPLLDAIMGVAFDASGTRVLYEAGDGDRLVFGLDDRTEALPAGTVVDLPVLNAARGTVGLAMVAERAFFHLAFGPQAGPSKEYSGVTGITFSPDGSRCAYVAEEQGRNMVVVNGAEGPAFDKIVNPAFSPDGTLLVYRAREDGKRFVVVADASGKTLRRQGEHEQVLPVSFTPDGASIAYAVKDGPRLLWLVEKLRP